MVRLNAFEEACREWMKGCSCAPSGKPWECADCTAAFHGRLQQLRDALPTAQLPTFRTLGGTLNGKPVANAVLAIPDGSTVNVPMLRDDPDAISARPFDWFQNFASGWHTAAAAMRMTPDNGYFGYRVFDSDGTEVSHVAWVDDTKQELACYEWPFRIVADEVVLVIKQVNGVRVDHMNKAIHVNTGVMLTIQSKGAQTGGSQPRPCDECRQEETCRRISYCAQYRCAFGEVDKP